MTNENLEERAKVIVGLGKTGLSCARFLHARGESFRIVDSRTNPPCLEQFRNEFGDRRVELGPFRSDLFVDAEQLIVSPGVSLEEEAIATARDAGVSITGDIDLFSTLARAPIVAVTGSNGKSTVVSLVAAMFRRAGWNYGLGGNLDGEHARCALELLLEEERDVYVLELSSFQLETTRHLNAEVAVILNLSQDHMDRYPDMTAYLKAKQHIFRGARQVVVNQDNAASDPGAGIQTLWRYGVDRVPDDGFGVILHAKEEYLAFQKQPLLKVSQLKLAGEHNVSNVLAAMAVGKAMGLELEDMVAAVAAFPGLPHRCQWVAQISGVAYYNDSKGTNVGATVAAIEGLGRRCNGKLILIAGGEGKGADFTPLIPSVRDFVGRVVVIGKAAGQLESVLRNETDLVHGADMPDAVRLASVAARPGDIVLLSPACASFDMFNDFSHRGRVFMECVRSLQ